MALYGDDKQNDIYQLISRTFKTIIIHINSVSSHGPAQRLLAQRLLTAPSPLQLYAHCTKRPGRHLFHLNEQALAAAVQVVLLKTRRDRQPY